MVRKSREIRSLFFQLSESVSSLKGRFNLLTYATPSFLQPTQYTEERTSRHLLADVRASTCYSHRRLKLQGAAVSRTPTACLRSSWTTSPLSRQPANWSSLHCQEVRLGCAYSIIQKYNWGGEWWKTWSIRCFWVIKSLLEANTSSFRGGHSYGESSRALIGAPWGGS